MRWLGRLATALLAATALILPGGAAHASRWGKDYVPNVPVVTQDGRVLNFYDDLIKDKIFVVSFLFTSCRDVCPLAAARLAQAQEKLGAHMGRDVFFYSISVDPENDTPARLKQYAEAFGAGPGWLFLTGAPEDIRLIRDRLGERSRFLGEHRNDVLLGNGATGEWQRDSPMGDMNRFVMAIHAMDLGTAGRKASPVKTVPNMEGYVLKGPPGEALFLKACAGCHTVGGGDRVGPDLAGVSQRRRLDWLLRFIANPEQLRRAQDPIALALAAKYPAVRMPAISISEGEAADLVAYIQSREPKRPQRTPLETLSALSTQDGTRLDLRQIQGRPLAIFFGFTHCPSVCPTALLEWSNVLERLGPQAERVRVLFVTVDPERDKPPVLKAYLESFDRRIIALTGGEEDIAAAAKVFGAHYARIVEGDGVTYDHTLNTYIVDASGRLVSSLSAESDESARVAVLRRLVPD